MADEQAERPTDNAPGASPPALDAIALLEADHRRFETLFDQFDASDDEEARAGVVGAIIDALRIHTQIEEEVFYPAARGRIEDIKLDEAIVEHGAADTLLSELAAMDTTDPLFDAKVAVLREQVEHHVHEEEDEMFPALRQTDMNLPALGAEMAELRQTLQSKLD